MTQISGLQLEQVAFLGLQLDSGSEQSFKYHVKVVEYLVDLTSVNDDVVDVREGDVVFKPLQYSSFTITTSQFALVRIHRYI